MSSSSVHPNRNAGSRPKPSRTYTYTPPERGNIAASSAYVSAPHSASSPPNTHTSSISTGSGTRPAITAGVRKMPPPMVEPTSTATALQKPRRRGRRSPQRSVIGGSGDVGMGAPNIHFRTHDATLDATRLARRDLHLPPHHPRRHRPHHRFWSRVRGALAAVQRQAASATRPADADRVRTSACGGGRECPRDGASGVRLVVEAGNGKRETGKVPRGGRLRCPRTADLSNRARCRNGEAEPAAVDRDPAPRHRDAPARDADSRRKAGHTDPGRKPGDHQFPERPALTRGAHGPRPRLRPRPARRAHRESRRGQRVPRVSPVQRTAHADGELPAARPMGTSAARLLIVRLRRVVGPTDEKAWCVVRDGPRHPEIGRAH